ncbi:hypothetical protein KKF05_04875 [Patescibacteria group bacterium]|nr:hypothetical protein [Patescibacteria group bacterium]
MAKNGRYRFAGTEGIPGSYQLLTENAAGRLSRRILDGGDSSRIRLEPTDMIGAEMMRPHIPAGWKTPSDGEFRFSCVVPDSELLQAIGIARAALEAVGGEVVVVKAAMKRVEQAAAGCCSSSAADEADDDEAEEAY